MNESIIDSEKQEQQQVEEIPEHIQMDSPVIVMPPMNLRSFEMREFLERPPNWWLRSGTTAFTLVIGLFFVITWLIKFPDKVMSPVTIVATPGPIVLSAPSNGYIDEIFIQPGQDVQKGELVANIQMPEVPNNHSVPIQTSQLLAPSEGKLYHLSNFKHTQSIESQDSLFVLVPKKAQFTAFAQIPRGAAKQIKPKQRVSIKLNDFYYMDYGVLEGKVGQIFPSPDFNTYTLEIELPQQMNSTYQKQLDFTPGMHGLGEIYIKEQRLIEKMLSGLTNIL